MATPLGFVDVDHRVQSVVAQAKDPDNVYLVDFDPARLDDVRYLADSVKGAFKEAKPKMKTIVIDSLTAIIEPLQTGAMLANAANEHRNQSSAFLDKALAMRYLQDAISQLGTDVLWIWHVEGGTFNGEETQRQTLSETERERLKRNLNAILEIVFDGDRRGIRVENLRPMAGQQRETTLWDESNIWAGMPERIDAFLAAVPAQFASKEAAIEHAVKTGVYPDKAAAEKAYNDVRAKVQPTSREQMFTAWEKHLAAQPRANAGAAAPDNAKAAA